MAFVALVLFAALLLLVACMWLYYQYPTLLLDSLDSLSLDIIISIIIRSNNGMHACDVIREWATVMKVSWSDKTFAVIASGRCLVSCVLVCR